MGSFLPCSYFSTFRTITIYFKNDAANFAFIGDICNVLCTYSVPDKSKILTMRRSRTEILRDRKSGCCEKQKKEEKADKKSD